MNIRARPWIWATWGLTIHQLATTWTCRVWIILWIVSVGHIERLSTWIGVHHTMLPMGSKGREAIHTRSIIEQLLENLHIYIYPHITHIVKQQQQQWKPSTKYLKYLVFHKRKLDYKQEPLLPPHAHTIQETIHRKVGSEFHLAARRILSRVGPTLSFSSFCYYVILVESCYTKN